MSHEKEPKTLLVVEDEPSNMIFISKTLALEGYQVHEARDVDEGLKALYQHKIDLIVLDLMLPGGDGWEIMSKLQNDPALSAIPVIVFTAAVDPANKERALSMGVASFLEKPMAVRQLKDTIHDILYN